MKTVPVGVACREKGGRRIMLQDSSNSPPLGVIPRQVRIQYPGAVCHVMDRGDRREAIIRDAQDRRMFLDALGEACARTGWSRSSRAADRTTWERSVVRGGGSAWIG